MTDDTTLPVISTAKPPTKRDRRGGIKAPVREAIRLLAWWGTTVSKLLEIVDAARVAGVSPPGLSKALRRPEVRALLHDERQAAISALRGVVPQRLYAIMMSDENRKPSVNAARTFGLVLEALRFRH